MAAAGVSGSKAGDGATADPTPTAGVSPAVLRAYRVKRWPGFGSSASPAPKGPGLFEEVRSVLSSHVRFGDDWVVDVAALWVLQAYVAPALPSVFYVLLAAGKGKAKTTTLDLLARLTSGLNASDVSVAALVHWLAENPIGAVCFDEVDVQRNAERDSAIAAICRNGYTPGKPYLRWDPTAKRLDECPTYGAKALGFRDKVDDALEDRGFVLPMAGGVPGREGAKLVRLNLRPYSGDLPARLKTWADARQYREIVEAEMGSSEWFDKVEAVVGRENIGANRETQLTMVALAVCRVACIDLTESLRAAFGVRREVATANTDEVLEEARDVLGELVRGTATLTKEAAVYVIRQKDFVSALDARRKEAGLRKLTSTQVARLRNDLGIREAWLTHPKNRATWNIPAREWDTILGRGSPPEADGQGEPNPPNPPNPADKDERVRQVRQVSHPAPEDPDPGDLFAGRVTRADRLRAELGGSP